MLGALSFELTVPTAKTFLRRFLKAALPGDMPADARLECLSSYLAELMLPEYCALQFLPSQVLTGTSSDEPHALKFATTMLDYII